jgi:hypothetical protein
MIMGMAGSIHGLIVVSCVAFLVLVFGFAFMIPLLLFPVLLWVMIASRYLFKVYTYNLTHLYSTSILVL